MNTLNIFRRLTLFNLMLHLVGRCWFALIMHQYAGSDVVGMIVLDLEVVNLNRAFEQLVLDLFDDNIFTVDEDENIARTEVCRVRPALGGAVERMRRCSNDLLAVDENVCQLGRFVDIGFNDLLKRNIVCFLVPCPPVQPARCLSSFRFLFR